MDKKDYLDKLELELRRLNVAKIDEVLADYNEHFELGLAKGKSPQQIAEKLGEPLLIAKAYNAENLISQMQDSATQDKFGYFLKACLRIVVLTPFNFFMLLGPFLVTACMVILGWVITLSLGLAGAAVTVSLFSSMTSITLDFWSGGAVVFSTLTVIGVSLLGLFVMAYFTKIIFELFIKYLHWNISFVKGRQS